MIFIKLSKLIERLQQFDPDMEVEVGTKEDSEKILAVYPANLYQGKGQPDRKVICIDIVPDQDQW